MLWQNRSSHRSFDGVHGQPPRRVQYLLNHVSKLQSVCIIMFLMFFSPKQRTHNIWQNLSGSKPIHPLFSRFLARPICFGQELNTLLFCHVLAALPQFVIAKFWFGLLMAQTNYSPCHNFDLPNWVARILMRSIQQCESDPPINVRWVLIWKVQALRVLIWTFKVTNRVLVKVFLYNMIVFTLNYL